MSTTQKEYPRQIVYNAVQCLACGALLESCYRHDYKTCGCPNQAMVDGGLDYVRMGGANLKLVRSIPVFLDEPFERVRKFAYRLGSIGKNSGKPVRLYKMSSHWLDNAIEDMIERNYGAQWHLQLLIREKQYRTEHEIFIDEEESTQKLAEEIKNRLRAKENLSTKEFHPLEKEEEIIRIPIK